MLVVAPRVSGERASRLFGPAEAVVMWGEVPGTVATVTLAAA